jgi:hypothetical protein
MSSSNSTESSHPLRPPTPPITAHIDRPIQPDLSFLDQNTSNMVYSAYICINKIEAWDAMANFDEDSFIFCQDPYIKEIMYKVKDSYNSHTGASLALTMRQLEYIAKRGLTEYRALYDKNVISHTY